MPTSTRPAADFTPEQLRFNSIPGYTVRADFAGGELSSDLGALVLGAVDRRIGLIDRLSAAITDTRDARYITHPMRDLIRQRVFQIASGYEDGNDANKGCLSTSKKAAMHTTSLSLSTDNEFEEALGLPTRKRLNASTTKLRLVSGEK